MTKKPKILAIIPARGGSKGVPGKNIKELGGKPLIQYAVDCALGSDVVDKILINSDDQKILDCIDENLDTKRLEIQLRPKELGMDNSSIADVVLNALENIKEKFDIIILLQVTSPIRSSNDIDKIIEQFTKDKELESVISVIPLEDLHPARMYNIDTSKKILPLISESETKHRQSLKPVYFRNGCFYAVRTKTFLEQKTFMPKNKKAYIMNPNHFLNIDSTRDIIIAEVLIKAWLNNEI